MDPNDTIDRTVISSLDYSMLTPEDREDYEWDGELECYRLRDLTAKFEWQPGDLTSAD